MSWAEGLDLHMKVLGMPMFVSCMGQTQWRMLALRWNFHHSPAPMSLQAFSTPGESETFGRADQGHVLTFCAGVRASECSLLLDVLVGHDGQVFLHLLSNPRSLLHSSSVARQLGNVGRQVTVGESVLLTARLFCRWTSAEDRSRAAGEGSRAPSAKLLGADTGRPTRGDFSGWPFSAGAACFCALFSSLCRLRVLLSSFPARRNAGARALPRRSPPARMGGPARWPSVKVASSVVDWSQSLSLTMG